MNNIKKKKLGSANGKRFKHGKLIRMTIYTNVIETWRGVSPFTSLKICSSGGFFCNKPSGSAKGEKYLGQLIDQQLLHRTRGRVNSDPASGEGDPDFNIGPKIDNGY